MVELVVGGAEHEHLRGGLAALASCPALLALRVACTTRFDLAHELGVVLRARGAALRELSLEGCVRPTRDGLRLDLALAPQARPPALAPAAPAATAAPAAGAVTLCAHPCDPLPLPPLCSR